LPGEKAVPEPDDVLRLLAAAVDRFGDQPAVRVNGQRMTYRELDARSDEIAGVLRERLGLGTGPRAVGLVVSRTAHLVPSLVGILKAGAAYIPLDPWLPDDRIIAMLTDGNAVAVVSDHSFDLTDWCRGRDIPLVDVLIAPDVPAASGPLNVAPDDPAYVIFTSGSTGRPKGVVVSHGNLAAFCLGWSRAIPFAGRRAMAATATIGFDIFLAETLVPLLNGIEVVLAAEGDVASPEAMTRFLRRESCDMMQATPSRMRWVLSAPDPATTLSSMRVLVVGGERLPDDLAAEVLHHSSARLFNAYGPTEATVWTSAQEIVPGLPVTIGRPMPGVRYEVDDPDAADGEGELVIVGDLVARYLTPPPDRPDPFFTTADGRRGYRSGDLVRGAEPDALQVLGRVDDQIKIDGYRVELGEIEAVARAADGVEAAHACLVGRDGLRTLALVVEGSAADACDLRVFMAARLPRYMMPTVVVPGHVPLSSAGKVSRRTVEEVAQSVLVDEGRRLTVTDVVDEFASRFAGSTSVAGAGVLGRRGLGSLACVRLLAQLEVMFGCEIDLGTLLVADTMDDLVQLVTGRPSADG
jgi:amino acid adenylation domain-containing protein